MTWLAYATPARDMPQPWHDAPWTPEPGVFLEDPMHPTPPTQRNPDPDLTIEELAELLDPPLTTGQIKALIAAAKLKPQGVRNRLPGRGPGRPPRTYSVTCLMKLHAALVPLLAEWGTLNTEGEAQ